MILYDSAEYGKLKLYYITYVLYALQERAIVNEKNCV